MIRSIVFEEGEVFVAQCLDHDFAAQGKTPEVALYRLAMTMQCNREEAERRGVPAFSNVTSAPVYYWEKAGFVQGNEFVETFVLASEAIEILRSPNKHNCCLAVKIEGGRITFVMGDLRIRTKLKSDFPPNAKFSPDFNEPQIKDWGQTIAFGDYEAEISAKKYPKLRKK